MKPIMFICFLLLSWHCNARKCLSINEIISCLNLKESITVKELNDLLYDDRELSPEEKIWYSNECYQGQKYLNNKISNKLNFIHITLMDYDRGYENVEISGLYSKDGVELLFISAVDKNKYEVLFQYEAKSLNEFIASYNRTYSTSIKVEDLNSAYFSSQTYGSGCSAGGAPTDGYISMLKLVRKKKKKLANEYLFSMNSQNRIFGAIAIEYLHRRKLYKTKFEQDMLDELYEDESLVDYCTGCTSQLSTFSDILNDINTHKLFYMYKELGWW